MTTEQQYNDNKIRYPKIHNQAKMQYAAENGISGSIAKTPEYLQWMVERVNAIRNGNMTMVGSPPLPVRLSDAQVVDVVQAAAPPAKPKMPGCMIAALVIGGLLALAWVVGTLMGESDVQPRQQPAASRTPCQMLGDAAIEVRQGKNANLASADWKQRLYDADPSTMRFADSTEMRLFQSLQASPDMLTLVQRGDDLANYCMSR